MVRVLVPWRGGDAWLVSHHQGETRLAHFHLPKPSSLLPSADGLALLGLDSACIVPALGTETHSCLAKNLELTLP